MSQTDRYWHQANPLQGVAPVIKMAPAKADFELFRGDSWRAVIYLYDVDDDGAVIGPSDLSLDTAEMLIQVDNAGTLTAIDTLTNANGRLVMGGTEGFIRPIITDAQALAYTARTGYWKLAVRDAGGANKHVVAGVWTLPDRLETRGTC